MSDETGFSKFTLGPRYGSEDMLRDMGVVPGSRVAFKKGDVIYTETVQSVTMKSAEPAIWPELSWWQQLVRRLTPARWRKPLKPIRAAQPQRVEIRTGGPGEDIREQFERHQASLQKAGEIIDGLIRTEPGER